MALNSADPVGMESRATSSFGDVLTSSTGFRVVVIEANEATLAIYRGVADQHTTQGSASSFSLPYDAFAHTDPNETISLSAMLADGQGLPTWVRFDPQSGKFEYEVPEDFEGELVVKVFARDSKGREASVMFRLTVGEKAPPAAGRAGLSEQLRMAAKRPVFDLLPTHGSERAAKARVVTPA